MIHTLKIVAMMASAMMPALYAAEAQGGVDQLRVGMQPDGRIVVPTN